MRRSNKYGFNHIARRDFASEYDEGRQFLRDREIHAANMFLSAVIIVIIVMYLGGCALPGKEVDLYVDATALNERGENQKAVEKLNAAVKVNKRFSPAYSLLGEIYQQRNDYQKSAASYEEATRLNPWSFQDFFGLGRVYQITKQLAKAVKAYARACELKPDHLEAHIGAAKCYYEIEDYNNALLYGQRAQQINPEAGELRRLLGDIYQSQKNYSQAISSYKRALEADSNNPEIMTSLAVAYLRNNTNYNELARELLTSVIRIQPDNSPAYRYLGYCYLLLKDVDKSIASYEGAVEINDEDWEAHRGLGVACAMKASGDDGDASLKAKAVEHWRRALEIKPDQPGRGKLLKLIETYSK
jgi:tetratricopeptide (TPR) repeat protein